MQDKLNIISNNLKSARTKIGLSQKEMAELLGVSRATYCDYEVNPQRVKMETYLKISEILKCNLIDFFIEPNVAKSDIIKNNNN